jgi:hypothetical protein
LTDQEDIKRLQNLEDLPEWNDLPRDVRKAILKRAKTDLFWMQFAERLSWLKPIATTILAVIALWSILNEAVAEYLQRVLNR